MPVYSKSQREIHKERIKRLLIREPKITIWKTIETFKNDKKNPFSFSANYVGKILTEIRDEMAINMQSENVKNLLSEYTMRCVEIEKVYFDVIDKKPITIHSFEIPDVENDPTGRKGLKKKVIEIEKTTSKDKMEAAARLQNAMKERMNAMIVIGNVPGSEEVDISKLNPSMNVLAVQNNFISEKELDLKEKDLEQQRMKLRKQIEKLDEKKDEKIIEAEIVE